MLLREIDGFVKSPNYLILIHYQPAYSDFSRIHQGSSEKKCFFCSGEVFFLLTRPLMGDLYAVHWTARAGPFCKYFQNQSFVFLASLVEAPAATDRQRWAQ